MILDGYTNNKLRFKSVFKVFFSSPTTTIISEAAVACLLLKIQSLKKGSTSLKYWCVQRSAFNKWLLASKTGIWPI